MLHENRKKPQNNRMKPDVCTAESNGNLRLKGGSKSQFERLVKKRSGKIRTSNQKIKLPKPSRLLPLPSETLTVAGKVLPFLSTLLCIKFTTLTHAKKNTRHSVTREASR
jgi:hypothetical protein